MHPTTHKCQVNGDRQDGEERLGLKARPSSTELFRFDFSWPMKALLMSVSVLFCRVCIYADVARDCLVWFPVKVYFLVCSIEWTPLRFFVLKNKYLRPGRSFFFYQFEQDLTYLEDVGIHTCGCFLVCRKHVGEPPSCRTAPSKSQMWCWPKGRKSHLAMLRFWFRSSCSEWMALCNGCFVSPSNIGISPANMVL
jgi:hypothetical protein